VFRCLLVKLFQLIHLDTGFNETKINFILHNVDHNYKIYSISQGKGKKLRTIEEPIEDLKKIQKSLVSIFFEYQLSPFCTSVRGSSAVQNAERHIGAKHILKIDIKSCYPSITKDLILNSLNENTGTMSLTLEELRRILPFCLIKRRKDDVYILPTGSPASPILCNIALTPLDWQIANMLSQQYGDKYIYSRYLDDMVISTKDSKRDWDIKLQVEKLIRDIGLKPHSKKSRWMDARDDSMIVTGVRVGEKKTVPRTFWRNMRSRLQHIAADNRPLDAETRGCLSYIRSVDEEKYFSLLEYFKRRQQYAERQRTSLESILHGSTSECSQRCSDSLSDK
jgi:retron-type reverse transcriptase